MNALIKNLVRQSLIPIGFVYLIYFAMFLAGSKISSDLRMGVLAIVSVGLLVSACVKVTFSSQKLWLQTLPLTRKQIAGLLGGEFILCLGSAAALIIISSILEAHFYPAAPSSSVAPAPTYSPGSGALILFWILAVIAFSPLIFLNVSKIYDTNPSPADKRRQIQISIAAVVVSGVVYFSLILSSFLMVAVSMTFCAKLVISNIYQTQKMRRVANLYAALVLVSVAILHFMWVEVLTSPNNRPAERVRMYGVFAPKQNMEDLYTLLNQPDLSSRDAAELASSASLPDGDVNLNDLQEWAKRASSPRAYFQGLAMFDHQLWTPATLEEFENELKAKCENKISASQMNTHFVCDLPIPINGLILMRFKSQEGLAALFTAEHPYLTALILDDAARYGFPDEWMSRMETIASSNEAVNSPRAKLVLARRAANQKSSWDCSRSNDDKSKCTDAYMVTGAPIGFNLQSMKEDQSFIRLHREK